MLHKTKNKLTRIAKRLVDEYQRRVNALPIPYELEDLQPLYEDVVELAKQLTKEHNLNNAEIWQSPNWQELTIAVDDGEYEHRAIMYLHQGWYTIVKYISINRRNVPLTRAIVGQYLLKCEDNELYGLEWYKDIDWVQALAKHEKEGQLLNMLKAGKIPISRIFLDDCMKEAIQRGIKLYEEKSGE